MQRKLLIADDNELNRIILHKILESDYLLLEASDGKEALDILYEEYNNVSAVLLDLGMPVMDGYEVLSTMRKDDKLAQIPVIVTTGDGENEIEIKALTYGANDFAIKPYKPDIIKRRVWNLINLRETSAIVNATRRDPLTGLFSRTAFFEAAAEMIAAHESGYYIMACFDIDNFKVVNDQYGTKKGDKLLCGIADIFAQISSIDGICCRINADNFACLYPYTDMSIKTIDRMYKKASLLDTSVFPLTFSIGRYCVNDITLSPSAMYDRAMMAKATVKGRYDVHIAMYDEKMRERILYEQRITSEMNLAIKNKNFEVWLQPQYNYSTGALIGAEALVRWNHPVDGMLYPNSFISVFEKNGFIFELDKYVWETACSLLRKWLDEGRSPVPISVNISRYDVFKESIIDAITGLVRKYDIPVELLRLEIAESAFSKSPNQIIGVVKSFIELGFTVEIDDFGSGHSSLNTLKNVPAQVVKIDMHFLEDDSNSSRSGNILESIVRMTKWLGASVIAEGVETQEQADFLKSIGCNYMQGYFYSPPVTSEEFGALTDNVGKEEKMLVMETVKTLDNLAFWNPSSMDTLIFNSYVGGACIFEYHEGKAEVLRANEKYARVISDGRITTEEALNIKWSEHLSENELKRITESIEKAISERDEVTGEFVFRQLPGCENEVFLRLTLRVIASTGTRYLFYCTNENVTAQRKAEIMKREVSEHLSAIMANINGGVSAVTVEDKMHVNFIFANDRYYKMLGYTREQFGVEVSSAFDCIYPDDRRSIEEKTVRASLSGIPFHCIYRVTRRDGKIIWIQSSVSITAIEGINAPVQIAVANEITAQIEAENRERRVSQQMQAIMDNAGSGITAVYTDGNKIKYLFANDKYYELLGYTRKQYEAEVTDVFHLIHEDDRNRVSKSISSLNETEKSLTTEYRIIKRDKSIRWLRIDVTITHFDEVDGPVQLAVYSDITNTKEAEYRLSETDSQLRFLNDTASDLLAESDAEKGIKNVLRKLLAYFAGNRVYIFEINYEKDVCDNTYEICADGVSSEKDNLQNVPFDYMSFWFNKFEQGDYISIDDVEALDESRANERRILSEQGIKALVAVPLKRDGQLIGFIGVDDPKRRQALADRLEAIGDYLAVMLTRRDLDAKIRSDNKVLLNLMNDTPGGFARIRVFDDGSLQTIYVNDVYCKMLGRTFNEVMAFDGVDSMFPVHPDDAPFVIEKVKEMIETKHPCTAKYRLLHKNGSYIWFYVFARLTVNECGEVYINSYYADLSEKEKHMMSFKETLPFILEAIMKSSTDLTFAKDSKFTYICCSEAFARITNLKDSSEVLGKTDYDLFDKEIADRFREDDKKLLDSGKSIIDKVEEIPSADEYTHYSSTSKYILRDTTGSVIGLYGVGRDITQYRTNNEQLQLLADNIPGGIAMIEICGNTPRFLYYNDGFYFFSGYNRDEYAEGIAENPLFLVFEEDLHFITDGIKHITVDGSKNADCSYRCHNKDGSYRWFNMKATVTEIHDDSVIVNAVKFDITEQKLAAEAERIHEEEMKIAMSQMGKMICEYDPATKTITMPEAYANWYGFETTVKDFPYCMPYRELLDPQSVEGYLAFYDAVIRGDKNGAFDAHVKRNGVNWHWEHYEFVSIFGDDGKPIKSIFSVEDITEQEEMKHRYEDELQLRHELIKDSVIYYEINLTLGLVDEYLSIYDDVPSMRTNVHISESIHEEMLLNIVEEDKEIVASTLFAPALMEAYKRGETNVSREYRRYIPKLGIRWVNATATIMKRPDNDNIVAFLYLRDVDRDKKNRLAVECIIDEEIESVIILDVEPRMIRFAKNNCNLYFDGVTNDLPFESSFNDFINTNVAEEDKEQCLLYFNTDTLTSMLADSESYVLTYRINHGENEYKRKRTNAFYLDETKREIVLSTRDITGLYEEEQRQKQALREAAEAANEASKAKSAFLSRMSHDIRTPLNAVLVFSGVEMTENESEEELRDNLSKIHSSGNYLLGIINNVLDMSRIEQKKMELIPTVYTFDDFKETIGTVINELCKAKNIEFVLKTNGASMHDIMVDKVKFNQVFMNLLSNAVKFTPENGKIELIVSGDNKVKDGVTVKRFIVRDNGAGMSSEYLPHAFDSFSQEHREGVSEKSQGTGLGLAIVKEIVSLMNGTISLESEIGKGTTFTIDLPLKVVESKAANKKSYENDDFVLSGAHILVCEDNKINAEIAVRLLKKKGCIVECAENGKIGLDKFILSETGFYDAIIMDIRMPVMNGIEAAEAIRKADRADASAVPIIAMTADAFTEDERISYEAGMNEHISKPIEPRLLFEALKRAINQKNK